MQASSALVSSDDLYLFNTGQLFRAYRTFGAHLMEYEASRGVRFVVWAPNARRLTSSAILMAGTAVRPDPPRYARSGRRAYGAVSRPALGEGTRYKYEILKRTEKEARVPIRSASRASFARNTASIVYSRSLRLARPCLAMVRQRIVPLTSKPMLIYEVHLASWRMDEPEQFRITNVGRRISRLQCARLGYSHIEIMPLTEHPFDPSSWGYQATGYFRQRADTDRPRSPKLSTDVTNEESACCWTGYPDISAKTTMAWTIRRNGAYEYPITGEPRNRSGGHCIRLRQTGSSKLPAFQRAFLAGRLHIDGLRVDAVASMIDLNFDKPESMRTANRYGGTRTSSASTSCAS